MEDLNETCIQGSQKANDNVLNLPNNNFLESNTRSNLKSSKLRDTRQRYISYTIVVFEENSF